MGFEDLVAWVEAAMERATRRLGGRGTRHVRKLHKQLVREGHASSEHWKEWQKLAVKCAALTDDEPPAAPTKDELTAARLEPFVIPVDTRHDADETAARGARRGRAGRRRVGDDSGSSGGVVRHGRGGEPASRRTRLTRRDRSESAPVFEVSDEFRAGLEAVSSGAPLVFVTGRAGTGKSTFIRYVQRELPRMNIVVVAPTGIAALNAGGQTIHSFFRFPPKLLDAGDVRELDDPSVVERLDVLVIDEISMVRADVVDAIDTSMRLHRKNEAPFGGAQVVMVGDLFQLPPVTRRDDAPVIEERYGTPFFFGAHALRGISAVTIELTRVHRQEDPAFIDILGRLRDGRDVARAVAELNRAAAERAPDGPHLMLVTRNVDADRENTAKLEALPGKAHVYRGEIEGEFGDDRLPAPRELGLKKDARVMFTRNDAERRWVNGTTGTVTAVNKTNVEVLLDSGETYTVEAETWENKRYFYDVVKRQVETDAVGSYTQIPLMPAWAVTIHKAQGLTLDRVHVDFGFGAFAEGQAYVALSRCRSVRDLTLARPLRVSDVRCSEQIRAFYRRMRASSARVALRVAYLDARGATEDGEILASLVACDADVIAVIADRPLRGELASAGWNEWSESNGVGLASRRELASSPVSLRLGCAVDVGAVTVAAVVLPGGEAKRAAWESLVDLDNEGEVLLLGNLNSGAHHRDEEGATMLCAEEFEEFSSRFVDVWRRQHGEATEFTWRSPRGRGFRIDHAFASPELAQRVLRCEYDHGLRERGVTAHSIVVVDLGT